MLRLRLAIAMALLCPGLALAQRSGFVQTLQGERRQGEGGQEYLAQPRDTFATLSERLGVTEDELAHQNQGRRVVIVGGLVNLPPKLTLPQAPGFGELLDRVERGESFVERGLAGSPLARWSPRVPKSLARRPDGNDLLPGESGTPFAERLEWEPFPRRGELPRAFAPWTLDFLDPEVTQACVAVGRSGLDGAQVRWHGRAPLENRAWGGGAFPLAGLLTVSALNRWSPGERLADLRVRGMAESRDREVKARDFLLRIAAERDGARAESLARFLSRDARQAWSVSQTGHAHELRGDFADPLFAPPALIAGRADAVLRGRLDQGSPGRNLLSAYDLVRLTAMAAWHPHLDRDQRLAATKGDGLALVLESMAHDRARYLDTALAELGLLEQLRHVAVVSSSGWDRTAQGYRATYVAALQADDLRRDPPVQRRFVLALATEHARPEWAEARLAQQVIEITRWLFTGELR